MTALLVAAGAALGAPLRYLVDRRLQSRHRHLPWGTLLVNVAGSALAGMVAAAVTRHGAADWLLPLVVVGFCGALTTFSTFAFETVTLLEDEAPGRALLNVVLSVGVAVVGCAAGWTVVGWGSWPTP
ncbi:MAG TPA: fluoride efflux transporter CrcB [Nocardioides sp.]|nr:fluoride efflux transporter CrcB [Nocardioides sp.]